MLGKQLRSKYLDRRTRDCNGNNWMRQFIGAAEDFIFAGSSALLLLLIHLSEAYWFLSFIALMPLIIRLSRASVVSSIRTGFLFGIAYLLTLSIDSLFIAPYPVLLKICVSLIFISALTGIVGWVRNRYGFNPLLIATIWAFLELGLIKINIIDGLFGGAQMSIPIFGAVSALFGFVIVSFIIVLANSLLLAAINKIADYIKKEDKKYPEGAYARWIFTYRSGYSKVLNLVPESRGPPLAGLARAY